MTAATQAPQTTPTGRERFLDEAEFIVSKTDLAGRITYANRTFLKIAGYTEQELLGANHNIIRHPDMPRCVFKYLWDTIRAGQEVFAYVINLAKNGDHYWVLAHVTPSFDESGAIVGYHSNRRAPKRENVETLESIYKQLCDIEQAASRPSEGMKNSMDALVGILSERGQTYDQFLFELINGEAR